MVMHEIYDAIESLGVVGVAVFWVYDRLKTADHVKNAQDQLTEKVEKMDEKLTTAMIKMADEVGSLAQSVSKLEGQIEVMRDAGR